VGHICLTFLLLFHTIELWQNYFAQRFAVRQKFYGTEWSKIWVERSGTWLPLLYAVKQACFHIFLLKPAGFYLSASTGRAC